MPSNREPLLGQETASEKVKGQGMDKVAIAVVWLIDLNDCDCADREEDGVPVVPATHRQTGER